MEVLDNSFFEAYKKLEKLCDEMYSCEHGVSEYITKMEESEEKGLQTIPLWRDQYKKIKHWRWLRNRLAHEGESGICTATDYTELRLFYDRMLAGKDPLTQLKKTEEATAPKKKPEREKTPDTKVKTAETKTEETKAKTSTKKKTTATAKNDTAPVISKKSTAKPLGTDFETGETNVKSKTKSQPKGKTAVAQAKSKTVSDNTKKENKKDDHELRDAFIIGLALVVIIVIICLIMR